MTDRASTLIGGRRERMERLLKRTLGAPMIGPSGPLTAETRDYLQGEAVDLYWNELEWEHITDEEALEEGPLTPLTFPGFLAFVRGLLLHEVMPDSLSPANPRPQVVVDILGFLAERVVELEETLGDCPSCGRGVIEMTWFYRCTPVEGVEREVAREGEAGYVGHRSF